MVGLWRKFSVAPPAQAVLFFNKMEVKMNEMQSNKGYLNMKGITQYTSLSPSTVHRAIKAGKLRYFQPGRKLLFKVVDVDEWVKGVGYEER